MVSQGSVQSTRDIRSIQAVEYSDKCIVYTLKSGKRVFEPFNGSSKMYTKLGKLNLKAI